MKKVISILLVIAMAIGLASIPVFAAQTEGTVTKNFTYHPIFRDVIEVNLYVTVKGTYSKTDSYAAITSITASATGNFAYRLSFDWTRLGQDAYLNIYDQGYKIAEWRYYISTSGGIIDYGWTPVG